MTTTTISKATFALVALSPACSPISLHSWHCSLDLGRKGVKSRHAPTLIPLMIRQYCVYLHGPSESSKHCSSVVHTVLAPHPPLSLLQLAVLVGVSNCVDTMPFKKVAELPQVTSSS
jgi:hypothetical protein